MQLQATGILQNALTSNALAALAEAPQNDVMALVQIAGALTLPDQHLEAQQQEKELAFQKLSKSLLDAFKELSQENKGLRARLEASESCSREAIVLLDARLQENVELTKTMQSASQAQEKQYQQTLAALNGRVEALSNLLSDRMSALATQMTRRVDTLEGQFSAHTHHYILTRPTGAGCTWQHNTATSGPLNPK